MRRVPSLSWLAPSPEEALSGIRAVVVDVVKDLRASGELVPDANPRLMVDAVRGGRQVFRGTRVPVAALFENFEDDASLHEFLEWFPGVTAGQARAVLTSDFIAGVALQA